MTFYEAALRVLEREGKPLHINAIVEAALKDNLLSHVGKSPEDVMQSRLLAMARRRTDRKIVATAKQTYALVDWGIPEDPAALEPAPEDNRDDEKPLRPRERHPAASPEKARIAGRGERGERPRKERREEAEERRRRRKLPPLSEVAFEVLSQAGGGPMSALDLAAAAREKELVSEDLGAEALLNALREDNRRRVEAGRKAAFSITSSGEITLEKIAGEPAAELEAAFAYAIGVPLTEGRGEEPRGPGASRLIAQANEHRRQIMRLVRRRLGDLELSALEKAAHVLLDQLGFREFKVARRGREALLAVARKKEGLVDLRYAIRLRRGASEIGRDDVDELRRDAGQLNAHVGMLVSAGDATREARQEAQNTGKMLAILMCGEALAEKCLEKRVGSASISVEVYDLDESFFKRCREAGRAEDRAKGRDRGGDGEERERAAAGQPPAAPASPAPAPASEAERATDAAALAARLTESGTTANDDAARRRGEEAQARLEAHERIEQAELQARSKPSQ